MQSELHITDHKTQHYPTVTAPLTPKNVERLAAHKRKCACGCGVHAEKDGFKQQYGINRRLMSIIQTPTPQLQFEIQCLLMSEEKNSEPILLHDENSKVIRFEES